MLVNPEEYFLICHSRATQQHIAVPRIWAYLSGIKQVIDFRRSLVIATAQLSAAEMPFWPDRDARRYRYVAPAGKNRYGVSGLDSSLCYHSTISDLLSRDT